MKTRLAVCALSIGLLAGSAPAQQAPGTDATNRALKGLRPRAAPADYQAHAQAGVNTLAADFAGHGVPVAESIFAAEDYVAVEVAIFGPSGAHLNVSFRDFSLRINGKKAPVTARAYEEIFGSLNDPEWVPPGEPHSKSKTDVGGGQGEPPPTPVKMPIPLRLAMEQKVQRASLPEGDRALPEAGLIFFPYRGKIGGIHSVELIYSGAAGKATLAFPQ